MTVTVNPKGTEGMAADRVLQDHQHDCRVFVSRQQTGRSPGCRSEVGLSATDLQSARCSSEMELVLEKNLDFLLRPRDDMWWLRKERLLVVKMQDSTARERGGGEIGG